MQYKKGLTSRRYLYFSNFSRLGWHMVNGCFFFLYFIFFYFFAESIQMDTRYASLGNGGRLRFNLDAIVS
ncbi:hypothetical protein EYC84_006866 [Monilinia fructicola]|uniref:Uncharacterized protein n=1 Tax=Monilinia fructicola TaxID=38448 RepID=A0A5M9K8K5_MONFR|nr:hypothetical protein EYC84_006866 [Monilinia fructicola]